MSQFGKFKKRMMRKRSAPSQPRIRRKEQLPLKPGQPVRVSKLNDDVRESICALIREGQLLDVAARLNGVDASTVYNWRAWGVERPESEYGTFSRAVEVAMDQAHQRMVNKLLNDPDWKATSFILKNRHPKHYRDRIVQEISGPDGGAMPMAIQTFNVVVELTTDANEQQPAEFRIEPYQPADAATAG